MARNTFFVSALLLLALAASCSAAKVVRDLVRNLDTIKEVTAVTCTVERITITTKSSVDFRKGALVMGGPKWKTCSKNNKNFYFMVNDIIRQEAKIFVASYDFAAESLFMRTQYTYEVCQDARTNITKVVTGMRAEKTQLDAKAKTVTAAVAKAVSEKRQLNATTMTTRIAAAEKKGKLAVDSINSMFSQLSDIIRKKEKITATRNACVLTKYTAYQKQLTSALGNLETIAKTVANAKLPDANATKTTKPTTTTPSKQVVKKDNFGCVINPSIDTPSSIAVSYYNKPLKKDKNIIALDMYAKKIEKVCCTAKTITVHYAKNVEKMNKVFEKAKYVTGSHDWGCSGGIIEYEVKVGPYDEDKFVFNIVKKVPSSTFQREYKDTEKCDVLMPKYKNTTLTATSFADDVSRIYKTIKDNKKRIEKHGTAAEKKTLTTVWTETEKLKKSGDDYTKKLSKLKKKSCSNGVVRFMTGDSVVTDADVTSLDSVNAELSKIVTNLKAQREKVTTTSSNMKVSAKNINDFLGESKKNIEKTFKSISLSNDGFFDSTKSNFTTYKNTKKSITNEINKLISTARKGNLSEQSAKTLYDQATTLEKKAATAVKEATRLDLAISGEKQTKKDNEKAEKENQSKRKTDLNSKRNDLHTKYNDLKKNYDTLYRRAAAYITKTSVTTSIDKTLSTCMTNLKSIYDEAKKLDKQAKEYDDGKDATNEKKMDGVIEKYAVVQQNFTGKQDECSKTVVLYEEFSKTMSRNITTSRSNAKKAAKTVEKRDKDSAKAVNAEISAAETLVTKAQQLFVKREIVSATETLQKAMDSFSKAAGDGAKTSASINSSSFNATNTGKDNVKQREKIVQEETDKILDSIEKDYYSVMKPYNSAAAKTLKNEIKTVRSKADDCLGTFDSLFGKFTVDDKKAKKTMECAQTCLTNAKSLLEKTKKQTFPAAMKSVSISLNNNTLVINNSIARSVDCNGKKITIRFKKDYFVDKSLLKIVSSNDASLGCIDSNTNKKAAFSRKVSSIVSQKTDKIELLTEFSATASNTNANDIIANNNKNKLSVVVSSTTNNNIVGNVVVDKTSSFVNKVVVVEVVANNQKIASTTATLKAPTTSFAIKVPAATSANIASIVLKTNNKETKSTSSSAAASSTIVGGTAATFGVNANIKFVLPNKQNQVFYEDGKLVVEFSIPKESKNKDNVLTINDVNRKIIATFSLGKSQTKWDEKIKKLPEAVKTGDYFLALNVNGAIINNDYKIKIIREKNVFQKIDFTSPKNGESYNKGDKMNIRWKTTNARNTGKLSLYLDVENRLLHFEKLIAKNIDISKGAYDYVVDPTTQDTRFYVIAKYDCGLFTCAEDVSELFSINSQLCYNYTNINITPKDGNEYDIKVTLTRQKACALKSSDTVKVELVRTGSHSKYEAGFSFTGEKTTVTETLTLRSGKAFALRFLAKHKNAKEGEPSFEFSAPYDNDFAFDSKMLSYQWGCSMCPASKPWQVTEAMKEEGWEQKWMAFCNIFCKAADTGIAVLKSFLGTYNGTNDIMNLAKKFNAKQDAAKAASAARTKQVKDMVKKLTGCTPSFKLTCKSCKVVGNIKLYNFDTAGLNIETGSIELTVDYAIVARAELTLGFTTMIAESKTTVDNKVADADGKLQDPNMFFSEDSTIGKALNQGLKLDALDIPIWGIKAGLGTTRAPGGINASVSVALMVFARLQLKLTGKISFLITAKGSFSISGVIQSDNKYAVKILKSEKPMPAIEFDEARLGATLTASVGATAYAKIAKIIGFEVTFTVAQFTLQANFKLPPFAAITSKTGNCAVPHKFELMGTFDFFILNIKYNFLAFTGSHQFQPDGCKIEAFKICAGV